MDTFTCVVCKNKKYETRFVVQNKKIVMCQSCNLLQTMDFISPEYTAYHRDSSYEESEKFLKYFFEKRYNLIQPFAKKRGNVLEIGCSTGVFLDLYKKAGWKTFGVEPSQSSQIAIKKGHTVVKSSFEETHLIASTFDLIIANHVLEHVVDPVLFLKKAHKLLKNGGILFIDVPNAGSFSQSILNDKWPYFLPYEHISHFTKETLIFTLSKAGFTPVFSKTKSGLFEVSKPIAYLLTELLSLKKNVFIDLWRIPENIISEVLDKGNSISIISKKHA